MSTIKIEVPTDEPIALIAVGESLIRTGELRIRTDGDADYQYEYPHNRQPTKSIGDISITERFDDSNLLEPKQYWVHHESESVGVLDLLEVIDRNITMGGAGAELVDLETFEKFYELYDNNTPAPETPAAPPAPETPAAPPAPETPAAPPAPETPKPEPANVGSTPAPETPVAPPVDSAGLPWDARIHASTKTKVASGEWKKRKKPADLSDEQWQAQREAVEAELRQLMSIPAAPSVVGTPKPEPANAGSTPDATEAATAEPVTFKTVMDHVSNLIRAGNVTVNQISKRLSERFGIEGDYPLQALGKRDDLYGQVIDVIKELGNEVPAE